MSNPNELTLPELMRVVLYRLEAGEHIKHVLKSTGIRARVDQAIAVIQEPDFVSNNTEHSALVAWYWTQEVLHNDKYTLKVHDAVEKAVNEAEKKFGVELNTDLRCQWEGIEFVGGSISAVTAAADYVAKKLKRFKGVIPLGL